MSSLTFDTSHLLEKMRLDAERRAEAERFYYRAEVRSALPGSSFPQLRETTSNFGENLQSESVFLPVTDGDLPSSPVVGHVKGPSSELHAPVKFIAEKMQQLAYQSPPHHGVAAIKQELYQAYQRDSTASSRSSYIQSSVGDLHNHPVGSPDGKTAFEQYDSRPVKPMEQAQIREFFESPSRRAGSLRQPAQRRPDTANIIRRASDRRERPVEVPRPRTAEVTQAPPSVTVSDGAGSGRSSPHRASPQPTASVAAPKQSSPRPLAPVRQPVTGPPASAAQMGSPQRVYSPEKYANTDNLVRRAAAVKVQSWWRGITARRRTRALFYQLWMRRLEKYFALLVSRHARLARNVDEQLASERAERQKLESVVREERRSRKLQVSAVKELWEQVTALQQWKEEMTKTKSPIATSGTHALPPSPAPRTMEASDSSKEAAPAPRYRHRTRSRSECGKAPLDRTAQPSPSLTTTVSPRQQQQQTADAPVLPLQTRQLLPGQADDDLGQKPPHTQTVPQQPLPPGRPSSQKRSSRAASPARGVVSPQPSGSEPRRGGGVQRSDSFTAMGTDGAPQIKQDLNSSLVRTNSFSGQESTRSARMAAQFARRQLGGDLISALKTELQR